MPADLAIIEDAAMKKHVVSFAKDQDKFFTAFAAAFQKLLELGVKFPDGAKPISFNKA
jgi:cytochrome c peroxidase